MHHPDRARSAPVLGRVPRSLAVRAPRALTLAAFAFLFSARAAFAQQPSPADSTRTAADSARRVEGVVVTAIRAAERAPIAQTTLRRAEIGARSFGQELPMLLLTAVPSLSAHTESGTQWGYSYLRLRGLDQTRINITLDGVPLNDMEDQVLYFANFADLAASIHSVQVQRGVGTSSNGTAAFGGSVNFETRPLATSDAGGDVQLQVGSYGARRASVGYASGLRGRFAAYARLSSVQTDGYRRHAGVMGRTGFAGAGWFGDRDMLKATALVGLLADTLSYVGATRAELATDRRFNPLAEDERDRFGQQMLALSHTRLLSPTASLNTTVYRNSASGNYDYRDRNDRYNFELEHVWYGLTSAWNVTRGAVQANLGVNANTYWRAHRGLVRPSSTLYDNTGHKDDLSGFAKLALDAGALRWFADLQARTARFRYEPDANAGIGSPSISWSFFNPRAGVTWRLSPGFEAFASYGQTSREPARNDLLGGEDDLNVANVGSFGDFSRVKPETVRDAELGANLSRSRWGVQANLYSMAFRNDIARIGAPTASGSILRRNVGSSYRRGLELDGRWAPRAGVRLSATAAWSANRIAAFTDSSRGAPVVRENVEPLLTPRFLTSHRAEMQLSSTLSLAAEGRYQSRAYLDNTGSADRILPDYYVGDLSGRWQRGRTGVVLRATNVGDSQRFGSGSVSGSGTVRFFVLPARALFATVERTF